MDGHKKDTNKADVNLQLLIFKTCTYFHANHVPEKNKHRYLISAQQANQLKQVQEDAHNVARVGCHPSPLSPVSNIIKHKI